MLRFLALAALVASCALAAEYRHHAGVPLNDLKATPGAVSTRTKAQICNPDFHTGAVRHVSATLKRSVCAAYGLPSCKGTEVDHLVSLELGGSNDAANLWPQPYSPAPGAREKDVLEDFLHRAVCSGDMTLEAAQQGIAKDWYALYLHLGLDHAR